MADYAHDWTDEQIEDLSRKFRREYNTATREMKKKLETYMESYERQNKAWQKKVKDGIVTQDQYQAWLDTQALNQTYMHNMVLTLSQDATRADELAMGYVNNSIPSVFAENANYAAYSIESGLGNTSHSFDLVDESTVRKLLAEEPDLLPSIKQPKFDNGIDLRWNQQRFTSAITQSILQGESVPQAAARISNVMRINESSAVTAARTALTSAENAGRIDSYKRAEELGIKLEKEWMATLDERTRIAHRMLDGQHVPVDKPFKVDGDEIEYPGDPTAKGYLVWNCRCCLVADIEGVDQSNATRWSNLPSGVTYDLWKGAKQAVADRLTREIITELNENDLEVIDNYIHGQYGKYTDYTAYMHSDQSTWSWSDATHVEFYEKGVLPDLIDNFGTKWTDDAERLYNATLYQNNTPTTICRVEDIAQNVNRYGKVPKKDDVIEFGIKSASSSKTFVEDYINSDVLGLPFDPTSGSEVQVFRVQNAKRYLDISSYSDFDKQQEVLFAGKYKVQSTETVIQKVAIGEEMEYVTLKEKIEIENLTVETFTSKKGKLMYRTTFSDGVTRDYTQSQYESTEKKFYAGRKVKKYADVKVVYINLVEEAMF